MAAFVSDTASAVRARAGDYLHASVCALDRLLNHLVVFDMIQCGRFACRADGAKPLYAVSALPVDELRKASVIDGAVLGEWRDHRSDCSLKFHCFLS